MVSPQRIDGLLLGLLFATYAYFYQGGFDNQNSRFDLALALSFEHQLAIDHFADNTIDKVSIGGHFYSEKAPLGGYLAALALLPATLVLPRPEPYADWLLYWATIATVSSLCAVAGVAFRRILVMLQPALSVHVSAVLATLTFAGSLVLPYATQLQGHALAAAWLILALYAGLTERLALCAGLLGASVASEYPSALPAASVALVVLMQRPLTLRRFVLLSAPTLPFAAFIVVHQWLSFGTPWSPGYGHLSGSPFAATMQRGWFGIVLPDAANVVQLLFSEYRGLFVYCPLLLVALAGLVHAPSRILLRVLLPMTLGAMALVFLISGYGYWQGGVCFGPRHLVCVVPLMALGLAFLPRRLWWWSSPFVVLSFILNLVATSTTLYVSEYDTKPLTHSYLRLVREGAVASSPMFALTATARRTEHWRHSEQYEQASWNWGERLGLKGWPSLAPLLMTWVVAAVLVVRASRRGQKVSR